MNKKAGFTLIELLTVIMIIAILASVVLISLETARNRTKDVTIQNQISQLRALAEASYSLEKGYEDISASGHRDFSKYSMVVSKISEMKGSLEWELSDDKKNYCAYSRLVGNTSDAFCVDSTGNAMVDTLANIEANCTADGVNVRCKSVATVGGCTVDADCPGIQECIEGICQ